MHRVEVCLSPALISQFELNNKILVIIDVLRATSTFATALYYGLESIIPVAEVQTALDRATHGYLTAGERDGKVIEGLAHGNSPTEYIDEYFKGKTLFMTTTNGTKCIALGASADHIITASFNNLTATIKYLNEQNKSVVLLCSGWKDRFNMEDTWCAGAIVEGIQQNFEIINDATSAALTLYKQVKNNMLERCKEISHYKRLVGNGINVKDINWCFQIDNAPIVVKLIDNKLLAFT